ncbi:GNAT family N-acetyltransferase [Actinoplanes sp. GCM10030250]|uniref:GNAT family N-acetyltransferase n=1 Tax=Actinoplanes sp. GCM10030250 TaxID=3273376 RepID=UPI00360DAA86
MRDITITAAGPADLILLDHVFGPFLGGVYRRRFELPGRILLAEINHRPAAAMFVSTGCPDEPEIIEHLGETPMLHRLAVVLHRRRTGLATFLIGAAEAALRERGHRRVAVGVDLENTIAVRLYDGAGFREWPHGRLKTFREHRDADGTVRITPDECLIFVKDL